MLTWLVDLGLGRSLPGCAGSALGGANEIPWPATVLWKGAGVGGGEGGREAVSVCVSGPGLIDMLWALSPWSAVSSQRPAR